MMKQHLPKITGTIRFCIWGFLIAQLLFLIFQNTLKADEAEDAYVPGTLWPADWLPHPHLPQPQPESNDATRSQEWFAYFSSRDPSWKDMSKEWPKDGTDCYLFYRRAECVTRGFFSSRCKNNLSDRRTHPYRYGFIIDSKKDLYIYPEDTVCWKVYDSPVDEEDYLDND